MMIKIDEFFNVTCDEAFEILWAMELNNTDDIGMANENKVYIKEFINENEELTLDELIKLWVDENEMDCLDEYLDDLYDIVIKEGILNEEDALRLVRKIKKDVGLI